MTASAEHVHDWGEWERTVTIAKRNGILTRTRTGDRLRECRTCGKWEVEWAETEETK